MAYYYLKNGGTATGDAGRYATQQTGSFTALGTANYYGTMAGVMAATTAPGAGDFISVSDSHTESPTDCTITGPTGSGAGLIVQCVADANIDQSAIASSAQFTPLDDMLLYNNLLMRGLYIKHADDMSVVAGDARYTFEDCTIEVTGAADKMIAGNFDGNHFSYNNCTLIGASGSIPLYQVGNGNVHEIYGGSLSGVTGGLTNLGFIGGGAIVRVTGMDLSSLTTAIIQDVGSAVADDTIDVTLRGCKLNASLAAFNNETLIHKNHRISAYNCGATSAAAEYQFYIAARGGVVDEQDDAGIHRGESIAFPSGERVSAHLVTDTYCLPSVPFWFELPARYAELSVAASDTIRIYLASTASLTDLDVWAELCYPDGTNKHQYNFLSSRNTNLLGSGTALTTDSGSTWKNGASDLVGYNEYYIDLDTSGDAGADGVPMIRIFVTKASTTIYFDTSIGLV